jgi:hypothetical protein
MISRVTQNPRYAAVFLRGVLGFSFLSAVADRFGLWGAYGRPHVAWGDFSHFMVIRGSSIGLCLHRPQRRLLG